MYTSVFYYENTGIIHSIVIDKFRTSVSEELKELGILSTHYRGDIPVNRTDNIIDIETKKPIQKHAEKLYVVKANIPDDAESIIIDRGNLPGLGDYITILSVLQTLHKLIPKPISFVGKGEKLSLFKNHPFITPYEIGSEIPDGYAINLHDPCPAGEYESKSDRVMLSRNEIFSSHIGIPWDRNRPIIHLDRDDYDHDIVHDHCSDNRHGKIGVALRTAEPWKDYSNVEELIRSLSKDFTVYVYDQVYGIEGDNIINVVGLPLMKACAVASFMDLFITPDTGWFHLADALGIPMLGIFGSMDGRLHSGKYNADVTESRRGGFSVLNSWCTIVQGDCVFGKHPCMYDVCEGKSGYQPCMNINSSDLYNLAVSLTN